MRIGIDITPLQTGHRNRGIGTYVKNLILEAINDKNQDRYFLFAYRGVSINLEDKLPSNFEIVWIPRFKFGRFNALISYNILLPFIIIKTHLDLIHFTSFTSSPWVEGIPLLCPVPFIITICDLTPLLVPEMTPRKIHWKLFYSWQLRLAKHATHIITLTEASRKDIIRELHVPGERVTAIHLSGIKGVPHIVSPSIHILPLSHKNYILHVGGGYPNKNINLLLNAFSIIREKNLMNLSLVLVGYGYSSVEDMKRQYSKYSNDIYIYSDISTEDLNFIYSKASVFVYPSIYEGFGLPPLEAMANKVPVIATDGTCFPEILGNAALLVSPTSPEKLAEAIERVLTDPKLVKDLVQMGLIQNSKYSWKETFSRTKDVYSTTYMSLLSR